MSPPPTSSAPARSPAASGDWLKVVVLGAFLAGALYLFFFYEAESRIPDAAGPPVLEESTPVPELHPEIMARARDSTRSERLVTDVEPLEHLLERSLLVTPAVARKLGMPDRPEPISRLRQHPDRYRGAYLWYKGQLELLSPPKSGHPVPGYSLYEGMLRTADGEPVLFAFSVPPPADLKEGDWVRMEGFFLKLRDAHFPVSLDRAPMLVGPELLPAYADWDPVEELDSELLAQVRDGTWNGTDFDGGEDMATTLADSQDVPLWHLASYALHRADDLSEADWPRIPPFVQREQFEQVRTGEMRKGTLVRVMGSFIQARILPAEVNPLGIESWSEVWVQIRDLGGKTVPIWVPGRIDHTWRRNMTVMCFGYLFKRYRYTTVEGDVRWTPLFVAARLDRFELPDNPLSNAITMGFAGVITLVGLIIFFMARRDRRQRERHEALLLERRRKRRGAASAVGEQPCTS